MYLTINSKNPNYQFIHIDVIRNYAVICKFNFYKDSGNELFDITHCLVMSVSNNKKHYHSVKKLNSTSTAGSGEDYKYIIDADLSGDPNQIPGEPRDDCKRNSYIRNTSGKPTKDNIIDLHIKNHPGGDVRAKTDLGDGFCRFYII